MKQTRTIAQVQTSQQSEFVANTLELFEGIPLPFLAIPVIVGILLLMEGSGKKKGKLGRAWWGGRSERRAARKLACKLMRERKHNKVALYIRKPKGLAWENVDGKPVLHIPEDPKTVYIPHVEEGVMVVGRPGSGKTYSSVDPLVRASIDQGFPVIYYDFKGHENPPPSSFIAGYAKTRGYEISVFAPGSEETCVCNLLDFLRDNTDADMAYQLASVLAANFKLNDKMEGSGGGDFFSKAGNQLVQAILMLAKQGEEEGDIGLCHKLLAIPDLLDRLKLAELPQYTKVAFDNFLSSAGSPETAASIKSTASLMFTRFMTPEALAAFCGKTTLPLELEGRKLIIFRLNPEKRFAIGPLLVSTLHLLINKNIYRSRKTPLIVSLDELPSIDLIDLHNWLNQNRSSGFVGLLGFQSFGLLEGTYGKQRTDGIISGCTTQLVFQLNDKRTAEYYSSQLGREDRQYRQKSRSSGKGGKSHSDSDQQQAGSLIEVQELQQFMKGKGIILNPGYRRGQNIRIPILQKIEIPKSERDEVSKSITLWPAIKSELYHISSATPPTEEELWHKECIADKLIPNPSGLEEVQEQAGEMIGGIVE